MPRGDEIRDISERRGPGFLRAGEKWDSVIMDQLGPVGAAMIENMTQVVTKELKTSSLAVS